ncbi:nucleotidyltransferase substrate binding protein [Lonepinella sp. BR2474]|uniref:nucleotidyltransferase substrate binding protein n=1 Tax=Lonepinella sp. BR2474 TaxID=3434548 RepID=UPI003F6E3541
MTNTLDLSSLQKAIIALQSANDIVSNKQWFEQQETSVQNTLIAGLIQNFEFVYELSIKMLKRQLEQDALSPDEIDQSNFRDLLRLAGEKGLIDNVENWFEYRKMRNITSHTYDEDKAHQVCGSVNDFLVSSQALLKQLELRNGENLHY